MQIVLWIVTALVALAFLAAGLVKRSQPRERLASRMHWIEDRSLPTVRVIGMLEVLGAVGLALPRLTHVRPWLSVAAAAGLILTMIGGATVHLRRKEPVVPNLVLGLLSAAALYGAVQG